MRVYLPATLRAVAALLAAGEIQPPPAAGYAVTPALQEWYSSGDVEELEYAAMLHAAHESLRLLAADPGAPRRRVVLAADLGEGQVTASRDFDSPALVRITGPVRLRDVVSGHVDDADATADVAAAVAALAAADAGDDDAQFAVDGAAGHELAWYATEELADVPKGAD